MHLVKLNLFLGLCFYHFYVTVSTPIRVDDFGYHITTKPFERHSKSALTKEDNGHENGDGYFGKDGNEIGYYKKSDDEGDDGYEHFESYHDKDGDSYGHEKHESYGHEEKGDDEGHGDNGDDGNDGDHESETHSGGDDDGDHEEKSSGYQVVEDQEEEIQDGEDEGTHGAYEQSGEGSQGGHLEDEDGSNHKFSSDPHGFESFIVHDGDDSKQSSGEDKASYEKESSSDDEDY